MTDTSTIDALLRRHAAAAPATTAVIDPENRLSYAELDQTSRELATRLITAGIRKGTRVGVLLPNAVTWVQLACAITRIGAVLVPLSTLLRGGELSAQLRTAAVQHVITTTEFRGRRYPEELDALDRAGLPALQRIWTYRDVLAIDTGGVPDGFVAALAATVRPADPMAVIFTSGSSGAPKGVQHSHGNAIAAVRSGLKARCVTAETRLYLPMPFFWVGGFSGGILTALTAGATLITEATPTPEATLPLLARERVTLFRGWPDQAEALARHPQAAATDLSALRPGSLEALLPPEQRGAPGARAKLFGMTESFGPYCGYPADTDMPASAWGSCGKPFPGMEVRIVDPDSGVPVPPETVGEIQIRGRHLMRGLCRQPRHEVFTADGYYPTGDLGRLDAQGFLFYHGRADDMFKVSGATVYPSEVEAVLRAVPGVRAAFVTNIDGARGNTCAALVVGDTDVLSQDALHAAARAELSAFKVPGRWLLTEDEDLVPRGATGKLDVRRLRALLARS
ncbi:class I adenylate-forming enzyme family protein [[Mycobacterium] wendilense]|uniref:Class I adenylate-forming enzyme family protein n=1 Tax=[Mycobacterium] wendilense TaxID=3064284 RepID=A0ABN9NY90_9MYCO|nr:class I adenylate-forming enzyme family protein [Mycolicibacterium sp. MU0050]CAJ1579536.1 class I adenylate-forming enzyme family protein [Mycolicibacterium sp. MU0050]